MVEAKFGPDHPALADLLSATCADTERKRWVLESGNYTFTEAGTYQEALAAFEGNRDSIELLISDISLPGGNGCELAIVLRRQKPDLRVLFVSGHCGTEICRYYSLEISGEHFLRKPFGAADLTSRIRQVLNSSEPFPKLYDGVERRRRLRR